MLRNFSRVQCMNQLVRGERGRIRYCWDNSGVRVLIILFYYYIIIILLFNYIICILVIM